MRICLFAEGSYPYVLGGVSSWINTLIKESSEHEFIIYAICADSKSVGKYKYEIPENVIEIKTVFLDNIKILGGKKGKKYKISDDHQQALKALLHGDEFSWHYLFDFFQTVKFGHISEFFMSKNFYNLVHDLYANQYPYTPFTEFLWTIRSMYLILFYLLMEDMPEADLYHSVSTGYAGVLASYAKFIYKKPYIISEHGIYTREREEEIIKAKWVKGYHKDLWIQFFYNLSHCAYRDADVVTALFDASKELQIELGCQSEKIQVIPNGVELEQFKNLTTNKKRETIHIGAIVRVVPIKDIKTMLQSFALVQHQVQHAKFYILGPTEEDEEYFKECMDMMKQLDLKEVYFTGTVDIKEYLGHLDILVLTSISEGQPLAVMEGMAAKKPHVCTNVGACKELLYGSDDVYGQAGFITHVMDYVGIAKLIIDLCQDQDLRQQMGDSAYHRIKDCYKKETYLNKYKALYKELRSDS